MARNRLPPHGPLGRSSFCCNPASFPAQRTPIAKDSNRFLAVAGECPGSSEKRLKVLNQAFPSGFPRWPSPVLPGEPKISTMTDVFVMSTPYPTPVYRVFINPCLCNPGVGGPPKAAGGPPHPGRSFERFECFEPHLQQHHQRRIHFRSLSLCLGLGRESRLAARGSGPVSG